MGYLLQMKLGIIDVGSNNIKLEIYKIDKNKPPILIYDDRYTARLGNQSFITKELQAENVDVAVKTLKNFKEQCVKSQCKQVIAVGTAALREANSDEFIKIIDKTCGLKINIISGIEEARLVYLAALASIPFGSKKYLLLDIGGGSTEMSICNNKTVYFMKSMPLGTVRLKDMFVEDVNGIQNKSFHKPDIYVKLMSNYVSKILYPYQKVIQEYPFEMGILSGGIVRSILRLIEIYDIAPLRALDTRVLILDTPVLLKFLQWLLALSKDKISQLKGISKERRDIIVTGSLLLWSLLDVTKTKQSYVMSQGLRYGILADYIHRKVDHKIYDNRQGLYKMEATSRFIQRFDIFSHAHVKHCAYLSLILFSLFQEEHLLDNYYRDICYASAMLHDIGTAISHASHHKHSQYLILHADIPGFSMEEKLWISLIARYHRKRLPKESDRVFYKLSEKDFSIVLKLTSLLRIADALDRSHQQLIKEIRIQERRKEHIILSIHTKLTKKTKFVKKEDLSLELWSFEKKKSLFENIFRKKLTISGYAEQRAKESTEFVT